MRMEGQDARMEEGWGRDRMQGKGRKWIAVLQIHSPIKSITRGLDMRGWSKWMVKGVMREKECGRGM